jgi:hypothetical protein
MFIIGLICVADHLGLISKLKDLGLSVEKIIGLTQAMDTRRAQCTARPVPPMGAATAKASLMSD